MRQNLVKRMSNKENKEQDAAIEQRIESAELALSKTEQFFEDNQKTIGLGLLAVLVIAVLVWVVKTQYFDPLKSEAQENMFNAQYYFEADSFNLALNGDGINSGFLQIIDEYGSTPAGELANYYAGVCYLKLGDFANAKKYLSDFSSKDDILNSNAIGLQGDAEVELGNLDNAISLYKKAISANNKITAPIFLMKLGAIYEKKGETEKAFEAYKQVKESYPMSNLVSTANKYMQSVAK